MQCDAAQLVCGKLSCVRHVGFNSEDAGKSWNFPKGEMTGTVRNMRARAMRASAWSSLLLALAVFVVHSSFSLITESSNYGLCALNTLVTSPSTTKTSKNRHTFHRNDILHDTVSLLVVNNTSHIFYIIES